MGKNYFFISCYKELEALCPTIKVKSAFYFILFYFPFPFFADVDTEQDWKCGLSVTFSKPETMQQVESMSVYNV